jgi:cell division protein FtsA
MEDMFSLVTAHLKKLGKNELLPAGIILTGGGSGIETIEDFARSAMKLPSKVPHMPLDVVSNTLPTKEKKAVNDTSWFVAYGLCIWGTGNDRSGASRNDGAFSRLKKFGKELMKQLLP